MANIFYLLNWVKLKYLVWKLEKIGKNNRLIKMSESLHHQRFQKGIKTIKSNEFFFVQKIVKKLKKNELFQIQEIK